MKAVTNPQSVIVLIKENHHKTLQDIYTTNYPKVEKFVLQNQGNSDQAKDIFQEAFMIVWQHIKEGRYSEPESDNLNGYLYTIARNKWLDHVRSAAFKKTIPLIQDPMKEETTDPVFEAGDEEEKRLKKAMEAFKKLGAECQEMLNKFYFRKQSLREIAQQILIDEASARNKKYRCMQKLRELTLSL